MKLQKLIHFELDGQEYVLHRDLLKYRNSDSVLPVPGEEFLLTAITDKKNKAGYVLPVEVENVNNSFTLKNIWFYFKNKIQSYFLKTLHHLELDQKRNN